MILVVDNYDFFVHTAAGYLAELGETPVVIRNDAALPDEEPEAIVISPGPCTPNEAGMSMQLCATIRAACRSSASASAIRRSGRFSAGW